MVCFVQVKFSRIFTTTEEWSSIISKSNLPHSGELGTTGLNWFELKVIWILAPNFFSIPYTTIQNQTDMSYDYFSVFASRIFSEGKEPTHCAAKFFKICSNHTSSKFQAGSRHFYLFEWTRELLKCTEITILRDFQRKLSIISDF